MESTNSSSRDHINSVSRKRCNYRVRCFYSKGAFLVLLWATLISATLWCHVSDLGEKFLKDSYQGDFYLVLIVLSCLTCIAIPLLGWLADAKLGNYRVFKVNSYFTLAAVIFASLHILYFPMLNSIALQYTSEVVLVLVHAVGVASILVCITTALQLGLDQMPDASSTNISSFISWFVFSIIFGFWIPKLLSNSLLYCTSMSERNKVELFSLFPVTCMVIICSSMFLLAPKWLIIEPKSPQALKTIYQVLKFAAKHKAPIYRSALTYWEEDVPSRLDLGKTKFGGPFTTEQVEDVKTFLRILVLSFPIFIILAACGGNYNDARSREFDKILQDHLNPNITECTLNMVYTFSCNPWLSGIVATAVYEFALYPLVRNKVPRAIQRIGGAALFNLLLSVLNLAMIFCPYVWVSVFYMGIFSGFVFVLLINGILEFVCAQSPYNMRGLLTGYVMFLFLLSLSLNYLIEFLLISKHIYLQYHVVPSLFTALSLIGLVLYCLLARWYKRRVRDENYNAHRVVEEIYDRYLANVQ